MAYDRTAVLDIAAALSQEGHHNSAKHLREAVAEIEGLSPSNVGVNVGVEKAADRPKTSNADEWCAWLEDWRGAGSPFIAVQIAEALDETANAGIAGERAAFERGYQGGLGFGLGVCDERRADVGHVRRRLEAARSPSEVGVKVGVEEAPTGWRNEHCNGAPEETAAFTPPDYQDGFNTANERADERIRELEKHVAQLRNDLVDATDKVERLQLEKDTAHENARSLGSRVIDLVFENTRLNAASLAVNVKP